MTTVAWDAWDAAREAGELPTEMARALSDAELARLLADAGEGREEERQLLAAEALRRSTDLAQERHRAEFAPDPRAEAHRRVVDDAAERIHAAERKLERLSVSRDLSPDLHAAHHASLLAEEHRAQVETGIAQRAELHASVEELRARKAELDRRRLDRA